jgi:hypothetical protein
MRGARLQFLQVNGSSGRCPRASVRCAVRARGESRLGLADPADRLGRFRLPFWARPQAAVSVVWCRCLRRQVRRTPGPLRPASLVVCPHLHEARHLVPVASLPGRVGLLVVLRPVA